MSSQKKRKFLLNRAEAEIIKNYREDGELPIEELVRQDSSETKVRAQLSATSKKYKEALKNLQDLELRYEASLALGQANRKRKQVTVKRRKKTSKEAVPVAVASDWHIEEPVAAESVNDMNEYSVEIAHQRADRFFNEFMDLVDWYRGRYEVHTAILALLGDFISGYIHDELVENNELSPVEAVLEVQNMLTKGIDTLLKELDVDNLILPCCVGNHGRTTLKKRHASLTQNSYEYMLYRHLAKHYRAEDRLTFMVNKAYFNYVDVYGYLLRFHHGDNIRYGGGVGGLTIPTNKAIAKWNEMRPAYLDIFGHLHTQFDGGSFIANGSLIGYNTFALSIKAPYAPPQQTCFLMTADEGKKGVVTINV